MQGLRNMRQFQNWSFERGSYEYYFSNMLEKYMNNDKGYGKIKSVYIFCYSFEALALKPPSAGAERRRQASEKGSIAESVSRMQQLWMKHVNEYSMDYVLSIGFDSVIDIFKDMFFYRFR